MGEAKRRGSYEQRKAEGQMREAELKCKREAESSERSEREALLTEGEIDRIHRARLLISMMQGFIR